MFPIFFNFNNMENQPTKLDIAMKVSVIAGVLIVAFYFLYFLPNKEQKLETARKDCWNRYKGYSAEFFPDNFKKCMSEKGLAD